MKKIKFTWVKHFGQEITENFEFEEETTTEEIQKEFETWVWEQIGDIFGWEEV